MTTKRVQPDAGNEDLVSMLYQSRATIRFGDRELHALVSGARQQNRERGVTGALCFREGRFLQWLEGPHSSVSELFGRIGGDRRHTDVEVISFGRAPARRFGDWNLILYRDQRRLPEPILSETCVSLRRAISLRLRATALELLEGRADGLAAAFEHVDSEPDGTATLCEQLMATYAELWAEDSCNELDIAFALALAQSAYRLEETHRVPVADRSERPVLVAPLPGECHIFGAALAAGLLARSGQRVVECFPRSVEELGAMLDERRYRGLALVSSGVFSRLSRLSDVHAIAVAARRQAGAGFPIAVYGRMAAVRDDIAEATGTDCGCATAAELGRFFCCRDHVTH